MKYLKMAILENFQSHKYSVIEFKQGLNVIVGPSDTGKSAIIRAIKWALYNEPAGDYFIREGENDCAVTLEFSDGTKIKRFRSRSKNIYFLYDQEGNETKFEGFGTSVPQEIVESIGVKKIYLDSDDSKAINLGEQLEGPFLLSERTSVRASAIGRLIGVNIVDDALRETLRDLRSSNAMKKGIDEDMGSLNKELESYNYLEELSERVKNIENITKTIKKKSSHLENLKEKSSEYSRILSEISDVNKNLESLAGIEPLDRILKDIGHLNNNYKYFKRKKEDIKINNSMINENNNLINNLNEVEKVENMYKNLQLASNKRNYFINIEKKYFSNLEQLNEMKILSKQLKEIPRLRDNLDSVDNYIERLKLLNRIKKQLSDNQRNIGVGTAYTEKLQNVDHLLKIYGDLSIKIERLIKFRVYSQKIIENHNKLKAENKVIEETDININIILSHYKDLLKKLEVCPLCLSNIDNSKIEHIIKHYN